MIEEIKKNNDIERRAEFLRRLGLLLKEFDVEIEAVDDGRPFGLHSPLIAIDFDENEFDVHRIETTLIRHDCLPDP